MVSVGLVVPNIFAVYDGTFLSATSKRSFQEKQYFFRGINKKSITCITLLRVANTSSFAFCFNGTLSEQHLTASNFYSTAITFSCGGKTAIDGQIRICSKFGVQL